MQIVIDIPDYVYCDIQAYKTIFPDKIEEVAKAIKYGTPFPKGHGRLIDDSNLMTVTDYDGENEKTYVPYSEIEDAPTIIEADKAGGEGV